MRKEEYSRLLCWFNVYVAGFALESRGLVPALELKRLHSLRVAENAEQIARELGLAEAEVETARAAGLLHDIGRFMQYARHRSFCDADTVDHGEAGYLTLRETACDLSGFATDLERVLFSVRYHNRKREDIRPGPTPAHDSLLQLVRDADKIDIMGIVLRSVEEDGFRSLPTMLPHIKLSRVPSPGVLAKAMRNESLHTGSLATLGDLLLQVCTWFCELNYVPSRELVGRKGLLDRFRRELPDGPELDAVFEHITAIAPRSGFWA